MTDEGNGCVRIKYDSKYMPMDACFKWGVEFDYCLDAVPGCPKYKGCVTRKGDTVCQVWKGEKHKVCTTIKFTDCYAIFVSR